VSQEVHTLDEDSIIPLYVQLSQLLRRQIVSGRYAPGDQLPTGRELCEMYDVSTITARQAVLRLVQEGLLYRKQGKGTFVAEPKVSRDLSSIYSFSSDMKRMGLVPTSDVLSQEVVSSDDLAESLELSSAEERVTRITRLRLASGMPLLLETTCIPYRVAPGLVNEDLTAHSLYETLVRRYDVQIASAVETLESVVLDKEEARLLSCPVNTAGFRIERIGYDASGNILELTHSITRADRCKFSIRWDTQNCTLERQLAVRGHTLEETGPPAS
jgi:GntR family transcriptional regulator